MSAGFSVDVDKENPLFFDLGVQLSPYSEFSAGRVAMSSEFHLPVTGRIPICGGLNSCPNALTATANNTSRVFILKNKKQRQRNDWSKKLILENELPFRTHSFYSRIQLALFT